MEKKAIVFFMAVLAFFSCISRNVKNNENENNLVSFSEDRILSYNLDFNDTIDVEDCAEWNYPDSTAIYELIFSLKPQVVYEIHDLFDTYQCRIVGELVRGKDVYKYFFNAGGYVALEKGDTSIYLGCEKGQSCEEYFLSRKYTPEEMEKLMDQ